MGWASVAADITETTRSNSLLRGSHRHSELALLEKSNGTIPLQEKGQRIMLNGMAGTHPAKPRGEGACRTNNGSQLDSYQRTPSRQMRSPLEELWATRQPAALSEHYGGPDSGRLGSSRDSQGNASCRQINTQ